MNEVRSRRFTDNRSLSLSQKNTQNDEIQYSTANAANFFLLMSERSPSFVLNILHIYISIVALNKEPLKPRFNVPLFKD